jgi:hypothetical protein
MTKTKGSDLFWVSVPDIYRLYMYTRTPMSDSWILGPVLLLLVFISLCQGSGTWPIPVWYSMTSKSGVCTPGPYWQSSVCFVPLPPSPPPPLLPSLSSTFRNCLQLCIDNAHVCWNSNCRLPFIVCRPKNIYFWFPFPFSVCSKQTEIAVFR